jgi:hypothetical protein
MAIAFATCFLLLREAIGSKSPWLGLLLMFYFMGLAKFGESFFVLPLPGCIRDVRAWETMGTTYQRLGVQRFGQLLRLPPLRFLNSEVHLAGGQRDLQALYRYAASSEANHFWAGLLFTPYIAYVWAQGHKGIATLFLVIQVLFNVYPILHLRLLRGRLDATFAKRLAKNPR